MVGDAIEREIFIQSSINHVWSLVSKVGFWIGDELHFDLEANVGELVVVETTSYGSFPVQVERLEAPYYAAYRWASKSPGAEPTETNSTLVEFRLVEQDGGVVVHLRESGFSTLEGGAAFQWAAYEDNVEGWTMQLERLVRVCEGVAIG